MTITLDSLNEFCGTRCYSGYLSLVLTDGTKYLSDNGGGFLLDIIDSYQEKIREGDSEVRGLMGLNGMQYWTLSVREDRSAEVTCDDGDGNISIRHSIKETGFPLKRVRVWVKYGPISYIDRSCFYVAMLPREN